MESALGKADIQGLYHANDVELQNAAGEFIQNYKKEGVLIVIKNLECPSDC